MKMTTSHRRHGVMRGKEEVEERGWETNDTTVRNLNEISTWKFITFFYVCVCVCWNVVTALHLTRHCGKHQLIRSLLAWFWKMFLSEKSGDNVMKKHLSFFVCLNTSFLRSKLLLYEAILSRSAIQMNHRKKNFRRQHYRVLYMHGSVEVFTHD